jgi:putative transposase
MRSHWEQGLVEYEALQGIDWAWLAMDGAMTKAPPWGEKVGRNPTDRGKIGTKRSVLTDGRGVPLGLAVDGANRHDFKMARETIASMAVERPDPTPEAPRGCVWTKAMTTTRGEPCWRSSGSRPISERGARKPKR